MPPFGMTPPHDDEPLAGVRILLVEDEALVAMDIEMTLQAAGATVLPPVATLSGAVVAADKGGFDIAVLDIMLRGEEVFPVADKLQARGVPIAFHSGHGKAASLAQTYPAAAICAKPCRGSEMIRHLARLSDSRFGRKEPPEIRGLLGRSI